MNHDVLLKDLEGLFIEYNDTTNIGDYHIEVSTDTNPENPRKDWDNLGRMVCFHDRYLLGDDHGYETARVFAHVLSGLYTDEDTCYLENEQLERCWDKANEKNIILPLYLYDHSGISMSSSPFACPWDSGQVGWIYVSLEDVRKEWGWKRITKKRREHIINILTGEVEVYDHFLTGSVYGFEITKGEDEEHVDSCWGYFGYYTDDKGYMQSVIKDAIKYDIEHTPQQQELL